MKNLFVFALCLTIVSGLFTSCEKEALTEPTTSELTVEDLDQELEEFVKNVDFSTIEEAVTEDSAEDATSRGRCYGTYMRARAHDYRGIWSKRAMGYSRTGIMKSCDGNPTYIAAIVVDSRNRYVRRIASQYNRYGYSKVTAYQSSLGNGQKLRFYYRNFYSGLYEMRAN